MATTPKLTKTQQKLFDINIESCENEKTMGENAALEVACSAHGVTSQWFYDNYADHSIEVNEACEKHWSSKEY